MDTKILIIAADPDIREFHNSYFSKRKYEVVTAQNPQEALEAASKSPPVARNWCRETGVETGVRTHYLYMNEIVTN